MTIRKVANIYINASAYGRMNVEKSRIKFYSYDKDSAAIDLHFCDESGKPVGLKKTKVVLMILTQENDEWKQFSELDQKLEILDESNGIARYVIPDRLRGYTGKVVCYVYLDFDDGSRTDECYFDFMMERSKIEEEFEHAGDYYISEIQDTIDEVIEELNNYAIEKMQGYDDQFTELNSKFSAMQILVGNLTSQTTEIETKQAEILQSIKDNDVFTKAESSANVVDQIAGTEQTVVPEKLLVDGNAGVAARNVNGTIRPFSQTDYDNLNSNIVIGTETTTNGNAAQFEFNMDVIAYIDSKYPSVFSGLTSTLDKLNKLKTVLKTIKVPHTARGATSSKFDWWNHQATSWAGLNFSNTASGFVEKTYEISSMSDVTFSRVFGNSGIFKTRIYSGLVSDGTQKSWVELRDFSLIIELEISAKDIIDYSIAAYHRENTLPQLNDLASRIAALESKQ